MCKAIFLDRDGTINVEKHYLYKIEDFEFLPGVLEGLRMFQDAGYLLLILTNQSGIARGYYTEEDLLVLNRWMLGILESAGIYIEKLYYCPHLPDAKIEKYRKICNCRKPSIGMYEQAIREFEIDLGKSFAIGDKTRDLSICETTKCSGFLIGNNESDDTIRMVRQGKMPNLKYADSLLDSAREIVGGAESRTKMK